MSPFALKCVMGFLIIHVRFCFIQRNAFSLKCAICTLQSLKAYVIDLKSHLMHSYKPFHNQGTQRTVSNKPLSIQNTQVKIFNFKHLQTSQLSL